MCATVGPGDGIAVPGFREDTAVRASSFFVTNFAVAIVSVVPLLCASSGPALSQPTPAGNAATSLPGITVDAPKHRATEAPRQAPRGAGHQTPRQQVADTRPASSLPSGSEPWVGCSGSAGGYAYTGCRNIGPGGVPFKTYNQCIETGLKVGWRGTEVSWYCSTLALKE